MFWGCIVKPGKPHQIQKELTDVLMISNVSLHPSATGKTSLFVKVGDSQELLITSLEAGKHEHANVNLYVRISDGVNFRVQGSGEVHICGFLDPSDEDLDDFYEEDDEEFAALHAKKNKLQKEIDEDDDEIDDADLAPAKPTKQVKTDDKKGAAPAAPAKPQQKPQQQQPAKAQPQPAKKEQPKPAAKKDEDELDEDDLENMTESELAALEAELEGEDLGDEEMDDDDLEGLEEDDEGMDEEEPKSIPNVSS